MHCAFGRIASRQAPHQGEDCEGGAEPIGAGGRPPETRNNGLCAKISRKWQGEDAD